MECSSPLAAMQPQSIQFGHAAWNFGGIDGAASKPAARSLLARAQGNFNFGDMSMKAQTGDYFSNKPARGASPTSSLAVDLSQNFHIDRSPQPPTPRRSLFSATLLGALNARESAVTPPPEAQSSNPNESMEISPLPHKVPFSTHVQVHSPTPAASPSNDSMMLSSPSVIPESPLNLQVPAQVERKKPAPLRPCLVRKSYTTSGAKSAPAQMQTQPFRFGTALVSPPATLESCFEESPQRPMAMPSMMGGPRAKSANNKMSPFAQPGGSPPSSSPFSNGSPSVGPARRASGPYQRPRKQFRRSLSMFEHPEEVFNRQAEQQRSECDLQAIMDVDEPYQHELPHFFKDDDSIPRITRETMVDVLDGKYSGKYDESVVVDCRFEYEYEGGHIQGAINFNCKEDLSTMLFKSEVSNKTLVILHCEYSAHRAPIAARHVRHEDRAVNAHQYPKLTYPEVYILDGGYSAFFQEHKTRCYPQNYVEMNDKQHERACERGLGRIKQQRGKLSRAATYAFGDCHNESPTASLTRKTGNDVLDAMDVALGESPNPMKRLGARRMASY